MAGVEDVGSCFSAAFCSVTLASLHAGFDARWMDGELRRRAVVRWRWSARSVVGARACPVRVERVRARCLRTRAAVCM